jgi:hypothetical protein
MFNIQWSIGYENIKLRIITNIRMPCGTCSSSKRIFTLTSMALLIDLALKGEANYLEDNTTQKIHDKGHVSVTLSNDIIKEIPNVQYILALKRKIIKQFDTTRGEINLKHQ